MPRLEAFKILILMQWGRQTSVPTNELDTLAWYKEPGLKELTDGTVCDVADRRQGAMVVA